MRKISFKILFLVFLIVSFANHAQSVSGLPDDPHGLSLQNGSELKLGFMPCAVAQENTETTENRKEIINEMTGDIAYWGSKYGFWMSLYWGSLTVSLIASVISASSIFSDMNKFKIKSYAALVAALSTSFLATFNPQSQANSFKQAYLTMKIAVENYKFDPRMTRCHLVQAYSIAESLAQHSESSDVAK